MSESFYPADKTDLMLKAASDTFHGLRDHLEKAYAENKSLREQCASLKEAAARVTDKVELQKVAASKETIEGFVDMLIDRSLIKASSRSELIATCESPEAMAKIAMEAIRLSEAPASQGVAVKGAAHHSGISDELREENEAWHRAATASGKWD